MSSPELLTCNEVARQYGVEPETVRRWARKGVISVVHVGPYRTVRITRDEADRHFVRVQGADTTHTPRTRHDI